MQLIELNLGVFAISNIYSYVVVWDLFNDLENSNYLVYTEYSSAWDIFLISIVELFVK